MKPLGDIPYAGFIGDDDIALDQIKFGLNEAFSYAGFPYRRFEDNKEENYGETSMVDLSLDEDLIFSTYIHSKRRNMIRKALKSGIEVREFYDQQGIDIFWPLLEELHNKLGYNQLSKDYYQFIYDTYAKEKKATILIAFKDNNPVSGVFLLGNKNYMHYYKGASKFGVKNEGQGELLQWHAIKLAKNLGSGYYDLCNLNKEKLPDIYRFKTGISKEIWTYSLFTKKSILYRINKNILT
jgi:lipid II:glycine glycyltransferase (peptidoglycan interpeptide bridge formation enzyme)